MDFASYGGRQFLIIVDCKTGWPDVIDMGRDTTAQKLTNVLRDQFCRTAVPDVLWSDGEPQFTSSKFANFLVNWGTSHITPSPYYPQSNGQAEAAVKSMKKLVSAAWQGRAGQSIRKNSLDPCCNTGTHRVEKMACPQPRNCLGTLYKTAASPPPFICTRVAEIIGRS